MVQSDQGHSWEEMGSWESGIGASVGLSGAISLNHGLQPGLISHMCQFNTLLMSLGQGCHKPGLWNVCFLYSTELFDLI